MNITAPIQKIILICTIIIIAPLTLYFSNFYGEFGSQADFGTFGDFINPFLAIINIIILFYITSFVHKAENNRSLFLLRHDTYKDIMNTIDSINFDFIDSDNYYKNSNRISKNLASIERNYSHLFPFFDTSYGQEIFFNLKMFAFEVLERNSPHFEPAEGISPDNTLDDKMKASGRYLTAKFHLINALQNVILNKPPENNKYLHQEFKRQSIHQPQGRIKKPEA